MNQFQRSLETRQALRTRIARQRRHLDRQIDGIVDGVMLVGSWRKFVQRNPGRSLFGAAGIGALVARLLSSEQSFSAIEKQLRGRFTPDLLKQIWNDFLNIFQSDSKTAVESDSNTPSLEAQEQQDG